MLIGRDTASPICFCHMGFVQTARKTVMRFRRWPGFLAQTKGNRPLLCDQVIEVNPSEVID
jgi:hypothetical protein